MTNNRDTATDDRALITMLGWDESGVARKRRLYLTALCRRFWADLTLPTGQKAIAAAEAFVDGRLPVDTLQLAHRAHLQAHAAFKTERGKRIARTRGCFLSTCALAAADPAGCRLLAANGREVRMAAVELLQEIFSDTFHNIAFDPRWRTTDTVGIARRIYDEAAFDRLPILADALMDAGCEEERIISHCRSEGPHVRGCWVVDLAMGWGTG
jgi:hypothetical protein